MLVFLRFPFTSLHLRLAIHCPIIIIQILVFVVVVCLCAAQEETRAILALRAAEARVGTCHHPLKRQLPLIVVGRFRSDRARARNLAEVAPKPKLTIGFRFSRNLIIVPSYVFTVSDRALYSKAMRVSWLVFNI